MRKAIWLLSILLGSLALPAEAQFGKNVPILAGSPEDKALTAINAATDPAEKLALIAKFAAELGTGDMAIVANDLYVTYYVAAKNYDKVFEYGEKLWGVDADNFSNGVNLVRAAQEKNDLARIFQYGEKTGAIVQRFTTQPAPEGKSAEDWRREVSEKVSQVRDNLNYVEQTLFFSAYRNPDAAGRAGYLLRFADAFPVSSYAVQAQEIAASSYQVARDYPKMLDAANKLLAKEPNDLSMLVLLADYYSEKGEQIDKAEACATRAITLLGTAKKPENVTEEQWAQQAALEKGLALSALGQVNIMKKKDAAALGNFKAAGPLLKADAPTYARNQYRMGFALLNLKRVAEARAALTEAASIKGPYQGLAQEKLNSLPPARTGGKKS